MDHFLIYRAILLIILTMLANSNEVTLFALVIYSPTDAISSQVGQLEIDWVEFNIP